MASKEIKNVTQKTVTAAKNYSEYSFMPWPVRYLDFRYGYFFSRSRLNVFLVHKFM